MTHETVKHDEYRICGQQIIVDTALIDGKYETMVLRPGGEELETEYNYDKGKALEAHEKLYFKWHRENEHFRFVKHTPKFNRLVADLKEAVASAKHAAELHPEDGGTCNFDHAILYNVKEFNMLAVKAAAAEAGITAEKGLYMKKTVYFLGVPEGGQADMRTRQAEAMYGVLKDLGYDCGMYYQMD